MKKSSNIAKGSTRMKIARGSGNVFKDIGFSDEEAAYLLARAELMVEIVRAIDQRDWTPAEAAEALDISEPRVSELRRGKMEKFSVDLLLRYLSRLGKKVIFTVKENVA